MLFPSFDEFINDVGEEEMDYILDSHFQEMIGTFSSSDPDAISRLVSQSVRCAVETTLDLLRRYHCWLTMSVSNAQVPQKDES